MNKLALLFILASVTSLRAQFITNNGIEIVNTTVVYTNGEWVNQGPIKNDGSIITTENWTNTGTLDPASTGGFILKYSTDKTFTPGGTDFGFLVKEGTGNADITGQFTVKDSLKIEGGLIKPLSAADILTVAETGTVSSAPGSFLEGGNLVRKGTGSLFFPVGKNGVALPITFVNVGGTNPSIAITVEDAPTGYTGGAGVNALIDFPYVWKATKTNVADSSFVEIEYPDDLPTATDLVVVRKITGATTYQGMGARAISNTGGIVKIRSYSRGAQGTFSIASGFKGNLETDQLALEALYNATEGASWSNSANWTIGPVGTWHGVTETGGQITSVVLPANQLKGNVPAQFADMAALETIDLSGNEITSLPDLSELTGITTLNVSNNKLDFASLLPNATITGIDYSNQAEIAPAENLLIDVGTETSVSVTTAGEGNVYQWKYNGNNIDGGTEPTYSIGAIGRSNMGDYIVEVTNPGVPNLTLTSGTKNILATANISGTIYESETEPVTNGKLTLFKVTALGAYEKSLEDVELASDGTYSLEKVVLDDYVLLAQSDEATYPNDLPTYFEDKIYWEEADIIVLNEHREGVDITMQKEPTTKPQGEGLIFGIFEEPIPGGRVLDNRRIANAGASVRRKSAVGRPQEDAPVLIAYVFTDELGQFAFEDLEPGEYLLNLQYPGYPMDEDSDIDITIGATVGQRSVQANALVSGNKIVVTKKLVTGWEEQDNRFAIFPNPTSAQLNIKVVNGLDNLSYTISNAIGSEVREGALPFSGTKGVEMGSLPEGLYIVQVKQGDNTLKTYRVVVTH